MPILGTEQRPLRVAVVGSGPSGFYAAETLFKSEPEVQVDMFDRLPAPFGLVRYGVAPDHESIKKVIKVYERTAENGNFAFLGNVMVGRDISVDELRRHYDALVFACGAQTDRRLGIPGEDLPGSYTATEFVAWYNGHPDYLDRTFDLSHDMAAVIGQGNVAIDVARILCKTVDELKHTDMAAHALEVLAESKVREVHMIGRRGPAQAAFTPPEIKEFGELVNCDPVVDPADLELSEASQAEVDQSTPSRKNVDILRGFADRAASGKSRRFVVHFYKSPREILGDGCVERIVLEKNRLQGGAGKQWAEGTGETGEMDCGIFFRSVGYRGVPLEGVPFDEKKGVFPNNEGRIIDGDQHVPGLYAVGWIKRGPSGVIGTNKPDSIATVKNLLEDLPGMIPCEIPDSESVLSTLRSRGVDVVQYDHWKKIDAAEIARGEPGGKPREKFVTVAEMMAAADLRSEV